MRTIKVASNAPLIPFVVAMFFSHAQAETLEGSALEAYDAYCPAGNHRAVWAEPLPGRLEGWVKLVCLDEDEQETSGWYVTPDNMVVAPDEAELPVYVRPFVDADARSNIDDLSDEDTIQLWLDFAYEEPTVPPLEFYGGNSEIAGSSGSATTGPDGSVVSTYQLNGQTVTEAEYEAWQTNYRLAYRAQDAERDRLIMQQVQLALYDLVDINQWHSSIDVDAINNGYDDNASWQFNSSLVMTLTGKQSRELLETGEGIVYISSYADVIATTDGGYTGGDQVGILEDEPLPPTEPAEHTEPAELTADLETTATSNSGGALSTYLVFILLTMLAVSRRRITFKACPYEHIHKLPVQRPAL